MNWTVVAASWVALGVGGWGIYMLILFFRACKEDVEIRRIGKRLGLTRAEVLRELRNERRREASRRFREDRQGR